MDGVVCWQQLLLLLGHTHQAGPPAQRVKAWKAPFRVPVRLRAVQATGEGKPLPPASLSCQVLLVAVLQSWDCFWIDI